MLSRVAYTLYWMQRYRERAENTARCMNVNMLLGMDLPYYQEKQWYPMVQISGNEKLFKKRYKEATEENVKEFVTFDRENPNSILSCLSSARENARQVRETITSEMWNELNTMYLFVNEVNHNRKKLSSFYSLYNRITRQCQLVTGIADTTMSRTDAWHFGRLGALLERSDMTTRLLDVKYFMLVPDPEGVGGPHDNIQWSALLRSVSGYEMYRKLWQQIHYLNVVQFLVLDKDFPRSIISCLDRITHSLTDIANDNKNTISKNPLNQVLELHAQMSQLTSKEIINRGLHEYVDYLQQKIIEIDTTIFETFFELRAFPGQTQKQMQES